MAAKLKTIISFISRSGGTIGLLLIAFMVLSTMADVTMRYFFNRPLAGVIEYCGILLPVLVFLGLAATQQVSGHIGVTLFLNKYPPRGRAVQQTVNLFICLGFAIVLGIESWEGAMYSYSIKEYRHGVIGQDITIWWAKIAMSVGFWMLCLQYVIDIANKFSQLRSGQYGKEAPSPESQKGVL